MENLTIEFSNNLGIIKKSSKIERSSSINYLEGFCMIRSLNRLEEIDHSSVSSPAKALRRVCALGSYSCELIVNSVFFESFIILVIVLNTVSLSLEGTPSWSMFEYLEPIFLYIYTGECLLRICASGLFVAKKAYMRDPWNLLDMSIVLSGWIEIYIGGGTNLSALRAFRVLRPIRSIRSIKGIKIIFRVLLDSIKPIASTLTVFFLFSLIFSIIGLQIWQGLFKYRCFDIDSGLEDENLCGNYQCPGLECVKVLDNPNQGATNFDNIFSAMLTVFQILTLDEWSQIMYFLQKSFSEWVFIYFVPLVLFGSFLLINLTLAFIKMKFTDIIHNKNEDENTNANNDNHKPDLQNNKVENNTHTFDVSISDYDRGGMICRERILEHGSKKLKMADIAKNTSKFLDFTEIISASKDSSFLDSCSEQQTKWNLKDLKKLLPQENCIYPGSKLILEICEDSPLLSSSAEDVILPSFETQETVLGNYTFEHVLPREEFEYSFQEIVKRFNNSLRKNNSVRVSYTELVIWVKIHVRDIRNGDKRTNWVKGEWSGADIWPDFVFQPCHFTDYTLWSHGLRGTLEKLSSFLELVVLSKWFNNTITIAVVLNTISLSLEHYGMSETLVQLVHYANLVFTSVFTVEMILKVCAYTPIGYLRDPLNYLDGAIVVVSVLELFTGFNSSVSAFRAIRVFRAFKVLRVAKLFRYLEYMSKLLRVINISFSISIYLALLLLIFIMIFALLGMELFANKLEGQRANYDNFHNAFLSTFQVLSLTDWHSILHSAMNSSVGPASALYFVTWIFIGNFTLLNVFLAILLGSFGKDEETKTLNMEGEMMKNQTRKKRKIILSMCEGLKAKPSFDSLDESIKENVKRSFNTILKDEFENLCEKSLGFIQKKWKVRIFCLKMLRSPWFDSFILIFIVASSFSLVLHTYMMDQETNDGYAIYSDIADLTFNVIFTAEMTVKVIAYGFAIGNHTYLRDSWNILDFIIVAVSWTDFIIFRDNYSSVKVLRVIKVIRPLKFISHNLSMKVVVNALISSFIAILNVAIVVLIVWLMFAILSVSFFSGKLYSCENPLIKTQKLCEDYGYNWVNAQFNFDNVLEAIMTLFILSSLEGWPDIMYSVVDATDVGEGPKLDNNPVAAYFILTFIIIGAFFFLNLFIGVVFERFQEEHRFHSTSMLSILLTKKQQNWVELQRLIAATKFQTELSQIKPSQSFLIRMVSSPKFELSIFCLILMNMLLMAMSYDGASSVYSETLDYINLALSILFILEALLKIIGLGLFGYFADNWNKFDFFVVMISSLEIVLEYSGEDNLQMLRTGPQLVRVFKLARVIKLLRLIRILKDITSILETIKHSIPSMINIFSLLTLVFFIYSIIGVFLFSSVTSGRVINEYYNFTNFHKAMVTLFTVSTGEDWHLLMFDCKQATEVGAYIFFFSFSILTSFIMINLFVMVVLQTLDEHYDNPESPIDIFNRTIRKVNEIWGTYSAPYKGIKMSRSYLPKFMKKLGPPLGAHEDMDAIRVIKMIATLNIPIESPGHVYYHDILFCLYRFAFGRFKFPSVSDNLRAKIIIDEEQKTIKKLNHIKRKIGKNVVAKSLSTVVIFYQILLSSKVFFAWKRYRKYRRLYSYR